MFSNSDSQWEIQLYSKHDWVIVLYCRSNFLMLFLRFIRMHRRWFVLLTSVLCFSTLQGMMKRNLSCEYINLRQYFIVMYYYVYYLFIYQIRTLFWPLLPCKKKIITNWKMFENRIFSAIYQYFVREGNTRSYIIWKLKKSDTWFSKFQMFLAFQLSLFHSEIW